MKLHETIRTILDTHHSYLRRAMPKISADLENWSRRDDAVAPLSREFAALCEELALHMMKEERILFPAIERFETAGAADIACGLDGPVAQMEYEHVRAQRSLEQIKTFTEKISLGKGVLPVAAERETLNDLKVFRDDLIEHIRKEEEDLFPSVSKNCRAAAT